ncbi:hypothetical protein, partial [Proteus mirabilis]|uniref:hypothetical protein n=1 Tax=Proteus mirabilis TaxID=584 RepID=UPI00195309E3
MPPAGIGSPRGPLQARHPAGKRSGRPASPRGGPRHKETTMRNLIGLLVVLAAAFLLVGIY